MTSTRRSQRPIAPVLILANLFRVALHSIAPAWAVAENVAIADCSDPITTAEQKACAQAAFQTATVALEATARHLVQ